jgi:geranyl-CoA carboxylase alpha subunit
MKGSSRKFASILVANRGEIACRILRSARDLGYRTIAVHSQADTQAPHVALADEAVSIGPAPVGQSYLDIANILDAAAKTGAQAIHPGYGFLSENAEFARACEAAGLVFIGPPAAAIELMGNKAEAKRRMNEAAVPCVPGYQGKAQDDAALLKAGGEIGFPLMVKASAGGGGRGMRLVTQEGDLPDALRMARTEAESAFGSGELILEKAIERPRHVEIQVFADGHGNVIHLGERDCSIQRRHQKVVEEAPCPIMTGPLRERMGQAAVEAARSIDYRGAGTVEFLLDEQGEFYFLEMNTRLQVEHPVTEMITGLDLVALQIAVARGEALPLTEQMVQLNGHAIEVRLYAEDPEQDFMPSTGRVELWHAPRGEGIRVDSGIASGQEISPFYDAMVAKIIAWGPTRETARLRLIRALQHSALFGLSTNRDFLIRVLEHPDFASGRATTAFIAESELGQDATRAVALFHQAATAAVLDYRSEAGGWFDASVRVSPQLMNWSSTGRLSSAYRYPSPGGEIALSVAANGGSYDVSDGETRCRIEVHHDDGVSAEISLDGSSHQVIWHTPSRGETWLALAGCSRVFINQLSVASERKESGGGGRVLAPMHGQLQEIHIREGDEVKKGQRLLVLEAMKMQHELVSAVDGRVVALNFKPGDQVAADDLIADIELTGSEDQAHVSASK